MVTKVTVRTKPMSGGRDTVYLDFYPPIKHPDTGKPTRREFLGLFLYSTEQREEQKCRNAQGREKTKITTTPILNSNREVKTRTLTEFQKRHNKETLAMAENVKAHRQLEIQAAQFGFLSKEKLNMDFSAYFKSLAYKRKGSSQSNWLSAHLVFEKFSGGSVKISELNEAYCTEYREHLLEHTGLKQNTKVSYFGKFRAALRQAYRDGLLLEDINSRLDPISEEETRREYLTLEEVRKLAEKECEIPELKAAALFSAFTGLRRCDILALTWGLVQRDNSGWVLRFTQQKTGGVEDLPMSNEAVELLGERRDDDKFIFEALTEESPDYYNRRLKAWIKSAGITKPITFHCFRHTYATLLLSSGTDIYVVKEMLGHKNIQTTQIYAKIINERKREAANIITLK